MSKLPHFLIENSCYFLTSTTYNRKPIFHNDHYAQILCNIIYNLRKREKISLLGFVIMPEHFHLLIIPAKGIEIPWIMQEIKKGSARLINMERFGRARGRARLPFDPCDSVSSQNSKTSSTLNSVSSSTPTLDSESSPTLIRSSGSSQTPLRYSGSSPTSLRYSGSSPTSLRYSGSSPTPNIVGLRDEPDSRYYIRGRPRPKKIFLKKTLDKPF
jgi:REP element-mobilizing transposase RayT